MKDIQRMMIQEARLEMKERGDKEVLGISMIET
jgi:hypothetical protein